MFSECRRHWFGWLVAAYLLYALAFIFKSSVVVDGQRYFLLHDDAMISMSYARNLAQGHGAVWYPGYEPVQGYSNPLWMLYMAAVHFLPLPPRLMSLPIQLTGAVLIAATFLFVKRITEHLTATGPESLEVDSIDESTGESPLNPAPFIAVLLTAFYYPLNEWSLRGMEVGLVAFGITLAVWAALGCAVGRPHDRWLFPFLGLLTAVRMDAVVPAVIVITWLAWMIPTRRFRFLLIGFSWLAIFLAAQLVIQKAYYHDWLPNTYYLKLDGVPLSRRVPWGLYVLFKFAIGFGIWLLIPLVYYFIRRPSHAAWLLLAVVAGQASYSIYVGGDAWEWWGGANRYLCVAMPLLFVLIGASLIFLANKISAGSTAGHQLRAASVAIALGMLTLLQTNCYQLNPFNSLKLWALIAEPHELTGHQMMLKLALVVDRVTTPQARIAVTWAGVLPYFAQRPFVDLLGKNDRRVAHGPDSPLPPVLDFFRNAPVPYCWPGHTKHDFQYSIGEFHPDLIQPWYDMHEVSDLIDTEYGPAHIGSVNLYLKKDTPEVTVRAPAVPDKSEQN